MSALAELLESSAEKYGDKTALIVEDKRLNYVELNDMANRAGNALKKLGVEKGDRVTLLMPNSVECIVAYHGIAKIGAVINPLNVMYRAEEIKYIMGDAGSRAVIAIPELLPTIFEIKKELPSLQVVVTTGRDDTEGALSFYRLLDESSSKSTVVPCEDDDFLFFPYTSGTTGRPKGAQLTHGNMTINAEMSAITHILTRYDSVITALPIFHLFGGNVVMNASFIAGATLVVHPAFDAEKMLQGIQEHRATVFEVVPTMFALMVPHPNASA
jgi:long-chain acyl-CoA synthetase